MSTPHRVLVPFELPDADPVPPVLLETLATMEVAVLGHYGLPEQTPPGPPATSSRPTPRPSSTTSHAPSRTPGSP